MEPLEIVTTSDGSHTLRNNILNETYHSIHGARQESMHVFIENGLQFFFTTCAPKAISILEVGFGTGLNALLAWQFATRHDVRIRYSALEPFPLAATVWSKLNYAEDADTGKHFHALHEAAWGVDLALAPGFTIRKLKESLEEASLDAAWEIVFFDAFAPSVQPGLWASASLKKVVGPLKTGGVFVTYSAKGQLKRDLRALGLSVETLPGPPGKNEMVRAVKQ